MKKGLIRNVVALGLVQLANYVFPLFTVVIVSRIIGPEKLGVINFAAAFMGYFTILINFGFDLSATRVIAANRDDRDERNRVFNQVILAKVLLFLVSVVLFIAALYLVPQLRNEKEVAIFSFLICFAWVITPNWLYQGMQELTKVAMYNLVAKIIFTVVILLVVRERADYIWQPLAIGLAQIAVGVYSFAYAIKRYGIKLKLVKLKPVMALLWNERILFFSMVVINLYTTTNVVLLGFLQNEEQVGFYTAGWRLIVVIQAVISIPLSQALFPFIGSAFSQSREKGVDVVKQIFPLVTVLTGAAAIVLWLLGPFVIMFLYGEQFTASIAVFRILAFVPMIIGWSNMLGIQTMVNLKMDKPFFRITAIGAVSSIGINFFLVTRFGYIGTAWCWLITELLITFSMYYLLRKNGIQIIERKYFTPHHFKKYLKPVILTVKQKFNNR